MHSLEPILLVDDDINLCQLLSEFLTEEGFTVRSVHSGEAALDYIANHTKALPCCIVLDIMMPGISGLETLRELRQSSGIPTIMLTGRGDDIDRILGLEMGADDYLGKPCNPRELSARIKAVLRRTQIGILKQEPKPLRLHGITLIPDKLEAHINGNTLSLTGAEFNVLRLLMLSAGNTLSKESLTEDVLHRPLTAYDRSIDVHVSRVRQKLLNQGDLKNVIKTVRGIGYQLVKTND